MNTFKSKSKQSRDTINWNLQIICWFFAVRKNRRNPFILAVLPEDTISNWTKFLFCSVNKLILSRPNYWLVRAFAPDLWCVALLRSFLFRIHRYVSLASRISYRLISTIYDSRMAGYTAVNPTQLSQIWSSPIHDFCIFKLVCQKSRLDICVYGIWISGSSISAISTTALYDFCHTTGCCPKIYIKMFQLCTAPW